MMIPLDQRLPCPLGITTLALPIHASSRSIPSMTITANLVSEMTLDQALAEANSDGFIAEIKEYTDGVTEPHQHDYDVRLFILEGEIRLTDVHKNFVHACGPGTKVHVSAGTAHSEDHGTLKMIVGRRHSRSSVQADL